jgi:hypothetical protein
MSQLDPLSDVANLAKDLTDGELLQAADFDMYGNGLNAAARELVRRWETRARFGAPAVIDGRLTFTDHKETCV